MTYRDAGSQPVYAPNSYGGPVADPERAAELGWSVEAGEIGRYAYEKHAADDDFVQPRALYRDVMTDTERDHLVTNIVAHMKAGVHPDVVPRVVDYWRSVHEDLGAQVAKQLDGGLLGNARRGRYRGMAGVSA
jgi:catalase